MIPTKRWRSGAFYPMHFRHDDKTETILWELVLIVYNVAELPAVHSRAE